MGEVTEVPSDWDLNPMEVALEGGPWKEPEPCEVESSIVTSRPKRNIVVPARFRE